MTKSTEGSSWDPGKGSFRDSVLAINFVADAAKLMLESSTSVSEVEDRIRRFLPSVGLEGCALDATMSSLIMSYWQPGQQMPLTTMREVHVGAPRLERLSGTSRLLDSVQGGTLSLADAVDRLAELSKAPAQRRRETGLATLGAVAGWVLFVDGPDLVTVLVALAATALTLPIGAVVDRLRLPQLTVTFVAATIVAAIPNLLAAAGVSLLVGPAVIGALFIYLPGRAFMSSVIDGLAGAPISAISRGVQALAAAGFLALGMLVGSQIGAGFGLTYEPDATATPLLLSMLGSSIGILGIAVAWAMPRRALPATLAIGAIGWLIVALPADQLATVADWPRFAAAAGVVGVLSALAASSQASAASVYSGVAVLPLVPGSSLYLGMLALAQGDTQDAASALGDAGVISLAIAIGVGLGLSVGRNAISFGHLVRQGRAAS